MSATAIPLTKNPPQPFGRTKPAVTPFTVINGFMQGLASLKLTVGLMAYAIVVVYVGTVAQQNADIWEVVREYFHAWLMWVDVNLFFPKQFFWFVPTISIPAPEFLLPLNITNFNTIPMPGGLVVGSLMVVNLLAAHGWRFKVQSRGARLLGGVGVICLGSLIALVIILAGHNTQGFQSKPAFEWGSFWAAFLGVSTLVWLGFLASYGYYWASLLSIKKTRSIIEIIVNVKVGTILLFLATLIGWGFYEAYIVGVRPSDEALRIVWQLTQGSLAALVLLVGCVLVFRKRGGMVLLHLGIGLLMFNELFVALTARERQVFLQEGQTSNYLRDIRETELAVIDPVDNNREHQVIVPRSRLLANLRLNEWLARNEQPPAFISDKKLPFDLAIIEYHANADVRDLGPNEKRVATKGRGLKEAIVSRPAAKGTDTGGGVDLAAAYIKVAEKGTGKDLGTYLLSQLASEQPNPSRFAEKVALGKNTYNLFLRFKHEYKPFKITLIDVRKDDYVASDTPRNYSSDIRIEDKKAGIDQQIHIKMNDPLRYRGDTFYQSGWHPLPGGKEATTLQVVHNRAWMIPYVACMTVVIGMIAHFLITVTRFIARRESEEIAAGEVVTAEVIEEVQLDPRGRKGSKPIRGRRVAEPPRFNLAYVVLPALAAIVFGAYVYSAARMPQPKKDEMDLYAFGQLPVAHLGRVKPLDSLARESVRGISGYGKETVKFESDDPERPGKKKTITLSAIEWLLDVASESDRARSLRLFYIHNPEVRRLFKLEKRKGHMYSAAELAPQIGPFETATDAARETPEEDRTVEQRQLLELDRALKTYVKIARSFSPPPVPRPPSQEELTANPGLRRQYMLAFSDAIRQSVEEARQMEAPRVLPLELNESEKPEDVWRPYSMAWGLMAMQQMLGEDPDPKTKAFQDILTAYGERDARQFNIEVARYQGLLNKNPPPLYDAEDVAKESYFNEFSPFYTGMPLYVMGFILALFGWLFRYRPLNWAAFAMIVLTLGLHAVALWWRMEISGRPPVTNLYSSAIFIGFACVLFGVVIEAIFRLGLGNIVASVAGFATLLIAYLLSWNGEDTVGVMQAVLDTQFWLATHVVCITLGYAATYLAGLLGLFYIVFGFFTPLLDRDMRRDLGRMIYGITCFAILFSFYGTVLGGLWADDSWGRFWGWDPKENGALIIVLWNALILHARWDKMVGDRGLAVLALGGNIVTSWSWFGVNQLGIGLHSYGFTSGVAMALVLFGFSQLVLIVLGSMPKRLWWSFQADEDERQFVRA